MIIRPAKLEDALGIARVHVRAWHAAYPGLVPDELLARMTVPARQAIWEKTLTKGNSGVLVAETDGVITGWASLGASRDAGCGPHVGEVYGMYVEPDLWGTGVGWALWEACKVELEKRFSETTLWTLETNARARKFYEQCGFVLEPDSVDKPNWLGVNRVRYRWGVKTRVLR